MKILFFIESLRSGGRERRLCELIKGLKAKGYEMQLVLTDNDIHYTDIFDYDVKIHIVKRNFLKKDPSLFFRFYLLIRKFRPDIIHTWSVMTTFYVLPSKILLKIPVIDSSITNTKPTRLIKIQKLNFWIINRIASNTSLGLTAYRAPQNKSVVIYNGFDFKRLENLESIESVRNRLSIKTKYVVAMVGSFSPQKDYDTFLLSAKEILKERTDITFFCIGAGDFSALKASCNSFNNIRFLGKQIDVESIMNVCDLGVLTSNSEIHGEGISNALLEFMALGKPVLATEDGGNVELIQNGVTGYLVPFRRAQKLSDMINHLINNDQLRISMGNQAVKIVRRDFSINSMIERFSEEYQTI